MAMPEAFRRSRLGLGPFRLDPPMDLCYREHRLGGAVQRIGSRGEQDGEDTMQRLKSWTLAAVAAAVLVLGAGAARAQYYAPPPPPPPAAPPPQYYYATPPPQPMYSPPPMYVPVTPPTPPLYNDLRLQVG